MVESLKPDYPGDKVLELFSRYAVNRNNGIFRLIEESLAYHLPQSKKILEFGAGKGEFINRFISNKKLETSVVEADAAYRQMLASGHTTFEKIEDLPSPVDFIFLIDVLEHIHDDVGLLQALKEKLNNGGGLFIYVPARKELYSDFDKSIGHFRRYSKKELLAKVKQAGFTIHKCRYHELLGYFASAIHKLFYSNSIPNKDAIRLYDRWLIPVAHFTERLFNPPIGKSLYLYATLKTL